MANLVNAKQVKRAARLLCLPLQCMLLAVVPLTAQAVNLKFLDDSLLAKLGAEEIVALKQEIGVVLDKTPDLEIINWLSPNTGIQVQIKPKLSFKEGTTECRRTLFRLSKGTDKPEFYRFDICRDSDKKWKVKYSLVSQLTEQDLALLEGTLNEVLGSEKDNKLPASWFNPESKNAGIVVPTAYFIEAGEPCRDVAISISNSTGGTMDGSYTFCKKPKGWERQ
jgi:surface antigen